MYAILIFYYTSFFLQSSFIIYVNICYLYCLYYQTVVSFMYVSALLLNRVVYLFATIFDCAFLQQTIIPVSMYDEASLIKITKLYYYLIGFSHKLVNLNTSYIGKLLRKIPS